MKALDIRWDEAQMPFLDQVRSYEYSQYQSN